MLISPTEPDKIKTLGRVSPIPEQHGADILMASRMGLIGIQRKEVQDLIASVKDGRLAKEQAQLKAVDIGVLIIEGRQLWSADGLMLNSRTRWTRAQQIGVELSAQLRGLWLIRSGSITETISLVSLLQSWASRTHQEVAQRSGPSSPWGRKGSKEWLYHLVQGIEGIGPVLAKLIVDKYGCPFKWDDAVTIESLMTIDGIGVGRAEKIISSLD